MDIVGRAHDYLAKNAAESGADALIAEMADEIERLREYKRAQAEDIMTLGQLVGKLEAHIRDLRRGEYS